ncbi:MAG: hypothetical protein ABJA98_27860 [Acidobacteriota bacterium]
MKRVVTAFAVVLVMLVAPAAQAQVVVFDPANIVQVAILVLKTLTQLDLLKQQYDETVLLGTKLPGMDKYKTVPIAFTAHDPSKYPFGGPWLDALNNGDPRGEQYAKVTVPILPAGEALATLTPDARKDMETDMATVEVTDSIASRAAHQVALVRQYGSAIQQVIGLLEGDILKPDTSLHRLTSILDKISAGELQGRRLDTGSNQMLSHVLEQLLAGQKRDRDTDVQVMNMKLQNMEQGATWSRHYMAGSADALNTWRQP